MKLTALTLRCAAETTADQSAASQQTSTQEVSAGGVAEGELPARDYRA